ncbi:MAG: amidohydrolase 2 [Aeromicrobium sp.]|nr:amidohydrolase 2 [Aeromicrobium sp.]
MQPTQNDPHIESNSSRRYLIVSTDSHVGPSLAELRGYAPLSHLTQFDEFADKTRRNIEAVRERMAVWLRDPSIDGTARRAGLEGLVKTRECPGQTDAHARLREMDASGISAEVIFAGGENDEVLPFGDSGLGGVAPLTYAAEDQAVGMRIFNRWMADLISAAPERLLGVIQIPIWDVDAAVEEIRLGRASGLRAVNLPAPRTDFASYDDPKYEPLWAVCEELEMALVTHSGGGDRAMQGNAVAQPLLWLVEVFWLGRRAVWQLIFGGVFERHPGLRFVLTEQRVAWVPETLNELESVYINATRIDQPAETPSLPAPSLLANPLSVTELVPRSPREYWSTNCFISGSTLAPFEAAMRHQVGVSNLMWGTDYPHVEGTWPHTSLALRHAFADVPEDEARLMLGETAVKVYGLDRPTLRSIADRIGPFPEDLSAGTTPSELPHLRSYAFRVGGPLH